MSDDEPIIDDVMAEAFRRLIMRCNVWLELPPEEMRSEEGLETFLTLIATEQAILDQIRPAIESRIRRKKRDRR